MLLPTLSHVCPLYKSGISLYYECYVKLKKDILEDCGKKK
jgi:hypothetical protein